jgi:hypothetical protein
VRKTELNKPNARYESTLRSFVREFAEAGEDLVPWVLADLGGDIAAYVEYLDQQSQGQNLPEGRVPHSTFWLVDDSGEIVAISNLRHRLNEFLSEFGGHIGFGVRRCRLVSQPQLDPTPLGRGYSGRSWRMEDCNATASAQIHRRWRASLFLCFVELRASAVRRHAAVLGRK